MSARHARAVRPTSRRRVVVRLLLASCALLGFGAAATSAAWSDTARFSATSAAARTSLQASTNGTTWLDADTSASGVAVDISGTLTGLQPNTTKGPITVHLKNAGTTSITLSAVAPVKTGALFTAPCALTVTTTAPGATTLAVGATTTMTVTVVVPDLPLTCQSKAGQLVLQFTGQS